MMSHFPNLNAHVLSLLIFLFLLMLEALPFLLEFLMLFSSLAQFQDSPLFWASYLFCHGVLNFFKKSNSGNCWFLFFRNVFANKTREPWYKLIQWMTRLWWSLQWTLVPRISAPSALKAPAHLGQASFAWEVVEPPTLTMSLQSPINIPRIYVATRRHRLHPACLPPSNNATAPLLSYIVFLQLTMYSHSLHIFFILHTLI